MRAMQADIADIRLRWAAAWTGDASPDELPPERAREKLVEASEDIHQLLKLCELLHSYGESRIALEQAVRSAVEANDAPSELALANLRRLHEQCLDVLERAAVELAGGTIDNLIADPAAAPTVPS